MRPRVDGQLSLGWTGDIHVKVTRRTFIRVENGRETQVHDANEATRCEIGGSFGNDKSTVTTWALRVGSVMQHVVVPVLNRGVYAPHEVKVSGAGEGGGSGRFANLTATHNSIAIPVKEVADDSTRRGGRQVIDLCCGGGGFAVAASIAKASVRYALENDAKTAEICRNRSFVQKTEK